MGSGGPGNITHIDNLYVKTVPVMANTAVVLGDYLIFDTTGYRTLLTTDFGGDDSFLDLQVDNVVQAAHDANNLTTTPIADRVDEVSVLTKGSDWVVKAAVGIEPGKPVGICRLDARTPIIAVADIANALPPVLVEILGTYKAVEFARLAANTLLDDDAIVSTGVF